MDRIIKRRLKVVLIAFSIIIPPLGYLIAISIALEIHNEALDKALIRYPNDQQVIIESLGDVNKAIKIYPWNYQFHMSKSELQKRTKDYKDALNSAQKGTRLNKHYAEGLETIGLIYEYLGKSDSANLFYQKAIDQRFKYFRKTHNKKEYIKIALLYRFLGDTINSKKYIDLIENRNEFIPYIFYIENYKSGGLKDFLDGEKIEMINDSIDDVDLIDSLLLVQRIYYESRLSEISNHEQNIRYTFKNVFKEKAKTLGFKEIYK